MLRFGGISLTTSREYLISYIVSVEMCFRVDCVFARGQKIV